MSYFKKIEYEIVLKDSFWVIRNCPKCGRKTYFINTGRFRVNANGSKLDIWLIYQCGECKHTLNLSIYERRKASSIPKGEYQRFLNNDGQLAEQYGKDIQLFRKNKAEIDFEKCGYSYVKLHETAEDIGSVGQVIIAVHNPCRLKIRPEKQMAEVLGLSRSQVKGMLEKGEMELQAKLPEFISASVRTGEFPGDK